MSDLHRLEALADAVLYEGYLLYPYHARALKNQRRWTFGCLPPPTWADALGEPSWLQTECLVRGSGGLTVRFRFLHKAEGEPTIGCIEVSASLAELLRKVRVERR